MKRCTKCQQWKPEALFKEISDSGRLCSWCKACCNSASRIAKRKKRDSDPGYRMREWRQRQYGLTDENYQGVLEEQAGGCAICYQPLKKPYVDHDHETGQIRGLLCFKCNTALGNFQDSREVLKSAIRYLTASEQRQKIKTERHKQ